MTDSTHTASHTPRRRRSAASGDPARRVGVTVAWVAAGLFAVVLVALGADLLLTGSRIHAGVRAGSIDLGSLTADQARERVMQRAAAGLGRPVSVTAGSRSWTVDAAQVGAAIDASGTVDRAMAVGRSGDVLAMVGQRVVCWFGGVSVTPRVESAGEGLNVLLDTIDASVSVPARDASITVSESGPRLIPATDGIEVVRAATSRAILTAFVADDATARVVTRVSKPAVSDAAARQALEDARRLSDGPVTVVFEGRTHNVDRATVAGWITFDTTSSATPTATDAGEAPSSPVLVARFDPARIGAGVAPFTAGIGRPAKDAAFIAAEGKVRITPSQTGTGPDLAALASDLRRACLSGAPRRAVIRLVTVNPRLTTEAAREMGIENRISSYTTTFGSGNKPRVNNIHLLAASLNNKLVAPGEVFSFNKTAGQRTAAKGYQEAAAIVNGKLVPQLGGGVCQVGTTIYNAVFFSGLPVVERRNHSFYISHYPKGRDCTVSWGGPDFRFRNDTDSWILIRTQYTNSSLTVALYGSDPGYDVEYSTSDFEDVKPFPVREIKDPNLPKGARLIEDAGVKGGTVTCVRTVYKAGQVVREDTFVSHYRPKEEVVRIGTKAPSKPTTSTP